MCDVAGFVVGGGEATCMSHSMLVVSFCAKV